MEMLDGMSKELIEIISEDEEEETCRRVNVGNLPHNTNLGQIKDFIIGLMGRAGAILKPGSPVSILFLKNPKIVDASIN